MKPTLILIFFIWSSISYGQASSNKLENLVIQFLQKATDTTQIYKLKKILRQDYNKYQKHFKFIPSLNPVNPKKSKRVSSKFGRRFHPIDKRYKPHLGVDISATPGTPIHATANGVIEKAIRSKKGYGNQIIIAHKFGFKTRYGHLYTFIVKEGNMVKKGDIIAFMGNTGKSTGSHLHYEVIKDNKPIDPYPFCFLEL